MKHFKSIINLIILVITFFDVQFVAAENEYATGVTHLFSIKEGIKSPIRIVIDESDITYVTNSITNSVYRFDPLGNPLGKITTPETPMAIAVKNENSIYFGSLQSGKVIHIDSIGSVLNTFGEFELISSMVIDNDDRLYIVDSKQNRVHVFELNGNFLFSFGEAVLTYPTGIAYDPRNEVILVADHGGITPVNGNSPAANIHIFNLQGEIIIRYGGYGREKGQFTRIQGITVDKTGRIYATDPFQGSVSILGGNGEFLASVGKYGVAKGELRAPMDVAIDNHDRIWVASMNNKSIDVYGVDGLPVDSVDYPNPVLPTQFKLLQNYPNPFNQGTVIPFILGADTDVIIIIYNLFGQRVYTINPGKMKMGNYTAKGQALRWAGTNSNGKLVSSGFYFYEIRAGNFTAVKRMLLLK